MVDVPKSVTKEMIECEIQNDGNIYENSQVTFQSGELMKHHAEGVEQQKEEELLLEQDVRFCVDNDVDYIIHSVY